MPPDASTLASARATLLDAALNRFRTDPDVRGIWLAGSLAAGVADEWSDIDLRVAVRSEAHARFVADRRSIPTAWPGFLFNEWREGTQHCVSHFAPFGKIDLFYLDVARLTPAPWLRLPVDVLHDPDGLIGDLVRRSQSLAFDVDPDVIDRSIGKGIAAAHEAYRRARRGELIYAQTLLDQLRCHVMQADDWLAARTPLDIVGVRYDERADEGTYAALAASYVPLDASQIIAATVRLARHHRGQVIALHERHTLARSAKGDVAAINALLAFL